MTNGVIDTFLCGVWTGCFFTLLIDSISSGDTLGIVLAALCLALIVIISIFRIRNAIKEKTINQIIIRYVTGIDPMDELKRLSEVDK